MGLRVFAFLACIGIVDIGVAVVASDDDLGHGLLGETQSGQVLEDVDDDLLARGVHLDELVESHLELVVEGEQVGVET
jgi:hypothetical protein